MSYWSWPGTRPFLSNGEGAEYVEMADGVTGLSPVRDSRNPHGPALATGLGTWAAFVDEVKRGDDF
ncbi:DUF397 domain-containing protein [Streptomyces sp. CWNU-1]|uniref:DUF397 domain-containing protein n=1 Tax=Streptomyces albipurpureus TaxID=2897419 RepID=A0ABT0UUC7_9ACTN|nr:DUF397 domain-containing protein [Streptomyces sp. CWNU-1]